jgi:hypothetical protein
LNRQNGSGDTINQLSITPNNAAQNFYQINTLTAGSTVVAGVNAGLISSFTSQPFLTSGLWDLNLFVSASSINDLQNIKIYTVVYVVDAGSVVANPQTPGNVIVDVSNSAIVPPVQLPLNVFQISGFSSQVSINSTSIMEYNTSVFVPYTNLSTYTLPYLQIQIYAFNSGSTPVNGQVYYQSSSTYSHVHTSLGLVGPTGPTPSTIWSYVPASTNIYYANGSVGIGTTTPDSNYILDVSGTIKTLGINNVSDYRIKENVMSLTMSSNIPTIDGLRPVMYYNKLLQKHEYGFIAHEVQEIFPDIVVGNKDEEQYQTINYTSMLPLIVKEIKEMKREISELKEKLRIHGIE